MAFLPDEHWGMMRKIFSWFASLNRCSLQNLLSILVKSVHLMISLIFFTMNISWIRSVFNQNSAVLRNALIFFLTVDVARFLYCHTTKLYGRSIWEREKKKSINLQSRSRLNNFIYHYGRTIQNKIVNLAYNSTATDRLRLYLQHPSFPFSCVLHGQLHCVSHLQPLQHFDEVHWQSVYEKTNLLYELQLSSANRSTHLFHNLCKPFLLIECYFLYDTKLFEVIIKPLVILIC